MGNKHSVDFKTGKKSRGISLNLDKSYKEPKGTVSSAPSTPTSRSVEDLRVDRNPARRAVSVQSINGPSAHSKPLDYRRTQNDSQTLPHPRPKTVAWDTNNQHSVPQKASTPARPNSVNGTIDIKPNEGERYINTDLKKVFKENEKKGRVQLHDVDENLNETDLLDKKLETLKRQKNGTATITAETTSQPKVNGITDFATVASVATAAKRRARKSKPAPRPATMQPQTNTTMQKKKAAPKPPTQSARPVTVIDNRNNSNNHDIIAEKAVNVSTAAMVEETPAAASRGLEHDNLIKDLQRTLSTKSIEQDARVIEDQSNIQATTEFDSRKQKSVRKEEHIQKKEKIETSPVKKEPSEQDIMPENSDPEPVKQATAHDWLVKNSYTHPLSTGTCETRAVVIERELTSKPVRKTKKRPDTPTDPISPDVAAALEDMSIEPVRPENVSGREIGTQVDAPVETGVQCTGETLKQRKTAEDKEKLGNILKLFIDKNAEKDSSRPADASPDTDLHEGPLDQADMEKPDVDKALKADVSLSVELVEKAENDIELEPPATALVKEEITLHKAVVVQTSPDESIPEASTSNKLQKSDSGVVVKTESEVESPRTDVQPSPNSIERDSGHEDSPSPESPNSDNGAVVGKHTKSKKKFGKITKSMKSMKNFMSSNLKSGAKKNRKSEESSEDADDEETQINDNWTLGRTKRTDNPTWYKDAYEQPDDTKGSKGQASESSNGVKRRSSNIALMSPKGWDSNAVQSNTYRPVSVNFNRSSGAGISADDLY